MEDAKRIYIFDTTLRDGEQSAGAGLTVGEKVRIAQQLAVLGVDIIEAGFAASSEGEFEAMRLIGAEVKGPTICSLARAVESDIITAGEALKNAPKKRIHTFISSSDIHLDHQMRISRDKVLALVINAVKRAKEFTDDVEFSPMDASRTERSFLYDVLEAAIDAGATTVNVPDTVGYALTSEFGSLIKEIRETVPNIDQAIVSVHCHNDLGLATANSVIAVENGARQVEGCINGLGERAGNAALEEVIMALHTRREQFNCTTNIKTEELVPTSKMIARIFSFPVQFNKAIVGKNAFRHSSGIHQDAFLKNRTTFEIMSPDSVGWTGDTIILGKLSGRAGLRSRLHELGYDYSGAELDALFEEFKKLADTKSEVLEEDLRALVDDSRHATDISHKYTFVNLSVASGNEVTSQAEITLELSGGETKKMTSEGTGPVDATFKAIDQIVAEDVQLLEFSVNAVTKGIDALGEVTTRVKRGDSVYFGRGSDTDIIVASAKAYLNAINRSLEIATKNI